MKRLEFYYKQRVLDTDLIELQDNFDDFLKSLISQLGFQGIVQGLNITKTHTAEITLSTGYGYDSSSNPIVVSEAEVIDLTSCLDSTVYVYLTYTQLETTPRIDGDGLTVYYKLEDSYTVNVSSTEPESGIIVGIITLDASDITTINTDGLRVEFLNKTGDTINGSLIVTDDLSAKILTLTETTLSPMVITSTVEVTNLNSNFLQGKTYNNIREEIKKLSWFLG